MTHSFEIHENFTFTLVNFLENCDSAGKFLTNNISTAASPLPEDSFLPNNYSKFPSQ